MKFFGTSRMGLYLNVKVRAKISKKGYLTLKYFIPLRKEDNLDSYEY